MPTPLPGTFAEDENSGPSDVIHQLQRSLRLLYYLLTAFRQDTSLHCLRH